MALEVRELDPALPAASYVRQSLTREASESREAQLEINAATAERFGVAIVATLIEPPSTGAYKKRGHQRAKWKELLELVRAGKVKVVIAFKSDRLTRGGGPGWAPLLEAAEAAGLDLDRFVLTPSGFMSEFEIGIRATTDREESKKTSERMAIVREREARKGLPAYGGRRPFGYTDSKFSKRVPAEAKVLHEAKRRVLAGESVRSVARDLERRGVRTSTGAVLHSSNLSRLLRSPYLAAFRVWHGEKIPGSWTPIFSVEEHEALLLAAGEKRAATVKAHELTGILTCGVDGCGRPLRSKKQVGWGLRYDCVCNRCSIAGDASERWVGEMVIEALNSDDVRRGLMHSGGSKQYRALLAKLAEDQAALEQASRDHYVNKNGRGDPLLGRAAFLAAQEALEESIRATELRLAMQSTTTVDLKGVRDIRKRWEGSRAATAAGRSPDATDEQREEGARELEWRRSILKALFKQIVVAPAHRRGGGKFKPDRLQPEWRI